MGADTGCANSTDKILSRVIRYLRGLFSFDYRLLSQFGTQLATLGVVQGCARLRCLRRLGPLNTETEQIRRRMKIK